MTNNTIPHEPCGPRVSSLSLAKFQSVLYGHFVIGPVDLPVYPSCSSATQGQASPQEPWSHCVGCSPACTKQITDLKPPPQTTLSEGSQANVKTSGSLSQLTNHKQNFPPV